MQDRIPLGTYPKWAGRLIRWVLNHRLPKRVTILLRGRGPRTHHGRNMCQDLPLQYAPRVALYLIYTHPRPKQDRRDPLPLSHSDGMPVTFVPLYDPYKPAGDDFCSLDQTDPRNQQEDLPRGLRG
jgi:hypothetical protein